MLGLLESVERDGERSQRHLASDLGIALGLVNAYLKRCVKMGLLKVKQAPARRYRYYLTPRGFVEKSRLTAEYLSYSFSLFRQARLDFLKLMESLSRGGRQKLALVSVSELAQIAIICALECNVTIVAIIDSATDRKRLAGVPVVPSPDKLEEPIDAVILTDPAAPDALIAAVIARFGQENVLAPELLGGRQAIKQRAA